MPRSSCLMRLYEQETFIVGNSAFLKAVLKINRLPWCLSQCSLQGTESVFNLASSELSVCRRSILQGAEDELGNFKDLTRG